MSRNEHFADGANEHLFPPDIPLYHGTQADFSPGDVIEPKSAGYAHATPHRHTAQVFGPKVYEVEAIGEYADRKMRYTGNETHYERLSPGGFRVVRGPVPKGRKTKYSEEMAQRYRDSMSRWNQS